MRSTGARVLFLVPGGIALLAGLAAGLSLLGFAAFAVGRLPQVHGPLLVFGFVATVVSVERAVALRRLIAFAAPALLGVGGILLLTPAPLPVGKTVLLAGTVAFVLLYVAIWRRQGAAAVAIQALGAAAAVFGAALWLAGASIPHLVPSMAVFLILTIAGERLELARIGFIGTRAESTTFGLSVAAFAACVAALLWPAWGYPLLGLALLALVAWLARHDVARHTIRSPGLPRFMAGCLLAGYAWLAVAAGIWVVSGPVLEGRAYDASVHAVFLGFVLSMIMAHAPVIFPAVIRRPLPYRPMMALPVWLLQASLVLRIVVGDARDLTWAVQLGGALNVVAVLAFVLMAVGSVI